MGVRQVSRPQAPSRPRVTFWVRLAYGVGQLAEGLSNGALNSFLIFYYSQVLGMSAALTGTAVGTSLFVDAIADPLAGSLSDHWRSRFGRRHPFMVAAMLPLAGSFLMLFSPPVHTQWMLFAWLVVWVNIARITLTLFFVPHLALGAELSDEYGERATLVSFRMFFNLLGNFAATVIGFQFFFAPSHHFPVGQLNPHAYTPFAATLGTLMVLSVAWAVWGTRHFIPFLPQAMSGSSIKPIAVLRRTARDVRVALRQRSFASLFSGVLVVYLMIGTDVALSVYMVTYFWDLPRYQIVKLFMAYPVGVAIGLLFAPTFQHHFGRRVALLFGTAWWAGFQVLPVILRLIGWFPENGSAYLLPVLITTAIVQGIGAVQANVGFGAALADVADENEVSSGRRQEGIFFSASSFSFKLASGAGSLLAGVALATIHWPVGPQIQSAANVASHKIFDLGVTYGPVVVGFSFLTMWFYSKYELTREHHAQILEELRRRRKATTPGEGAPCELPAALPKPYL